MELVLCLLDRLVWFSEKQLSFGRDNRQIGKVGGGAQRSLVESLDHSQHSMVHCDVNDISSNLMWVSLQLMLARLARAYQH